MEEHSESQNGGGGAVEPSRARVLSPTVRGDRMPAPTVPAVPALSRPASGRVLSRGDRIPLPTLEQARALSLSDAKGKGILSRVFAMRPLEDEPEETKFTNQEVDNDEDETEGILG